MVINEQFYRLLSLKSEHTKLYETAKTLRGVFSEVLKH